MNRRNNPMPPVDDLDELLGNLHDDGPSGFMPASRTIQFGAGLNCRPCDIKPFPEADTLTNPKFVFLRELDGSPEKCLQLFLAKVRDEIALAQIDPAVKTTHTGGTLVVDQPVTLKEPLEIPQFFTLAGVGMNGAGRIRFEGLFSGPAITFQENDPVHGRFGGVSTIRDIAIEGPGLGVSMEGIKAGSQQFVNSLGETSKRALGRFQFHRVRVKGFGTYGMQGGMNTYTVLVHDCEFVDNKVHIQLIFQCNSWRIRDCIFSGATAWAVEAGVEIAVKGELKIRPGQMDDLLLFGCRFERNAPGAILIRPGHNMGSPMLVDDPEVPDDLPKDTLNHPGQDTTSGVKVFGSHFLQNNGIAVKVEDALALSIPLEPMSEVVPMGPRSGARILCNFFGEGEGVVLPTEEQFLINQPMAPNQLDIHPLFTHFGFNASRPQIPKDSSEVLNRFRARRLDKQ